MRIPYSPSGITVFVLTALAGCGGGGGGESSGGLPAAPANTLPSVSRIADQSVDEDSLSEPISFEIGDAETSAAALAVRVRSSDPMLLPDEGIDLAGAGAARSLVLVPAPGQSGSATVTVEVVDSDGGVGSTSFDLKVDALFRGEFSSWVRSVPLARAEFDEPVGVPGEDEMPLPEDEDIPRIKFTDDSEGNPAAYDDLLPAEDDPEPED